MKFWKEVRRQVLVDGLSKRAACRKFGVGWHTLEKILTHTEPPGYQRSKPRKSKLDRFLPIIYQILEEDRQAPQKQRHTVHRIFQRLRDEYGYDGGETIAWTLAQPGVTHVLAGARHPEHIMQNAAAGDLELDDATLQKMNDDLANLGAPEPAE